MTSFDALTTPPVPVVRTFASLTSEAPLRAHTVKLDEPVDLLAVAGDHGYLWEHEGSGLAGQGEALRIELPGGLADAEGLAVVEAALAAIENNDEVGKPGCGPVAVGALPFDRQAPGSMVVPELIVGRSPDGTSWITIVSRSSTVAPRHVLHHALLRHTRRPLQASACSFTLTSTRTHEDWCGLVAQAVEEIKAGRLAKVVVGREVVVEANQAIDPVEVLDRLRALYPSCTIFSVPDGPSSGGSTFIGASPELLVSRLGGEVRSHPLAGTIPRSGDTDTDAQAGSQLLASAKERHEHQMVVDAVVAGFRPVCTELVVPKKPSIVALRNVCHLGTVIQGKLSQPAPTALELAAKLHPTPAVGGTPTAQALVWLARFEHLDRGFWSGPVGWMDASGNGEFVVGIRSAQLTGRQARLFAGVGVVADSDPAAELAETQLKLQALLASVVRP